MISDYGAFKEQLSELQSSAEKYLTDVSSKKSPDTNRFNTFVGSINSINDRVTRINRQVAGLRGEVETLPKSELRDLKMTMRDCHTELSKLNAIVSRIITLTPGPQLMEANNNTAQLLRDLDQLQKDVTALRTKMDVPASAPASLQDRSVRPTAPQKPLPPVPKTKAPPVPPRSIAASKTAPARPPRPDRPRPGDAPILKRSHEAISGETSQFRNQLEETLARGRDRRPSDSGPEAKRQRERSPSAETSSSSSADAVQGAPRPRPEEPQSVLNARAKIIAMVDFLSDPRRKSDVVRTEGLFRLSGSIKDKQKIIKDFDKALEKAQKKAKEPAYEVPAGIDFHVATGVLKESIKGLGFSDAFLDGMRMTLAISNPTNREEATTDFVRGLTYAQREALDVLFPLLQEVAGNVDVTKMAVENLGIVLGPNLYARQIDAASKKGLEGVQEVIDLNLESAKVFVELFSFYTNHPQEFK